MTGSEFFFFSFFDFFFPLRLITLFSLPLLKHKRKTQQYSYAVTAVALGWSALVCSQLWPPISILLPEHLRDFKQLVVGLLTCSCFFGRGSSSVEAAKKARKRKRKKQRRLMRRYYKSSGDSSVTEDDDDGLTSGAAVDDGDETNSNDDSKGKEGSGRAGDSLNSSFDDEGTVLGSVAPGREQRRGTAAAAAGTMSRSSGGNHGVSSAGGSSDDLSSPKRGAAVLVGEAKTIATLLVPTPVSFAIWLIDLFVLGALIAAAVIDDKRAEIALVKASSEF